MEHKQRDTVYGYVRMNYVGQNMANDIIQIIFTYYLIILDSVILTNPADIDAFYSLLSPKLSSILNKDDHDKFRLLYRNSKDGNSVESFHKHCDGHTNTVTLVQSNHGNIFGGFTTKDWKHGYGNSGWTIDNQSFLFRIKSKFNDPPKIFDVKNGFSSLYIEDSYGPTFGYDLVLQGSSYNKTYSELGSGYQGTGNELCGGDTKDTNMKQHDFEFIEYEVFAVEESH